MIAAPGMGYGTVHRAVVVAVYPIVVERISIHVSATRDYRGVDYPREHCSMIRTSGISGAEHGQLELVEAPHRLCLPYPNVFVGLSNCATHTLRSEVFPYFSHY